MTRAVEGGSSIEAAGGVIAAVLAVIGLSHVGAEYMPPIAAIVLGAAFVANSSVVAVEYRDILGHFGEGSYAEFGGGLGAESTAGVSAIVLGILALFGFAAPTLVAAAVITLSVGLILSSGVALRLNALRFEQTEPAVTREAVVSSASLSLASFIQIAIGVGALILGILSVIGIQASILALVALLGMGVSMLLSGGAMFGKMWSLLRD